MRFQPAVVAFIRRQKQGGKERIGIVENAVVDYGVIGNAEFTIPDDDHDMHINDHIDIGDNTWTFKATRSAAFEVAIGANSKATLTNLAAAINLDTDLNILAIDDHGNQKIQIVNADASAGNPVAGTQDLALSGAYTHAECLWNQANLNATGYEPPLYCVHTHVVANATNIATPFLILTPFTVTELRFRAVNASGVNLPSRTATAAIVATGILVTPSERRQSWLQRVRLSLPRSLRTRNRPRNRGPRPTAGSSPSGNPLTTSSCGTTKPIRTCMWC